MMKFVTILWAFLSVSSAFAFDFQDFASLVGRPDATRIKLNGVYEPRSDVKGGSDSTSILRSAVDFSVPVYRYETSRFTLGASYGQLDPDGTAGGLIRKYERAETKVGYSTQLTNQALMFATASFGSASDHLFGKSDVNTISSTWVYTNPTEFLGEGPQRRPVKTWTFFVNYSNNRAFLNGVPLLGFAYAYTPSREVRWVVGLPFVSYALRFGADRRWEWSGFAVMPYLMKTTLSYEWSPETRVGLSLDSFPEVYLRAGRSEKTDRVFYDEKKWLLNVRSRLSESVVFTAEAGQAFDRRFYEARNVTGPKTGKTRLNATPIFIGTFEFAI